MAERPKYQSQIEERITGYPYGYAFSASDFLDIADVQVVSTFKDRIDHRVLRIEVSLATTFKDEQVSIVARGGVFPAVQMLQGRLYDL